MPKQGTFETLKNHTSLNKVSSVKTFITCPEKRFDHGFDEPSSIMWYPGLLS